MQQLWVVLHSVELFTHITLLKNSKNSTIFIEMWKHNSTCLRSGCTLYYGGPYILELWSFCHATHNIMTTTTSTIIMPIAARPAYLKYVWDHMSFMHLDASFPVGAEFPTAMLAAITPTDIGRWICLKIYGTKDPNEQD